VAWQWVPGRYAFTGFRSVLVVPQTHLFSYFILLFLPTNILSNLVFVYYIQNPLFPADFSQLQRWHYDLHSIYGTLLDGAGWGLVPHQQRHNMLRLIPKPHTTLSTFDFLPDPLSKSEFLSFLKCEDNYFANIGVTLFASVYAIPFFPISVKLIFEP